MKFAWLAVLSCALRLRVPPKIHFLFLAVDKIGRPDVWERFFADVPNEMYRIFIHCKDVQACRKRNWPNHWVIIADPASTKYCEDLVGGEIRLLEEALKESLPSDKFILTSDSTLPVKPFSAIYASATQAPHSHFCIFPKKQWSVIPTGLLPACVDKNVLCDSTSEQCEFNPVYVEECRRSCRKCFSDSIVNTNSNGQFVMAVKTHQWKILSHADAKTSVLRWHAGYMRDILRVFHSNWHDEYRNSGCLDEFWHFAALYGTFMADCGENQHAECTQWAMANQCSINALYMLEACPKACGNCKPTAHTKKSFLDDLLFTVGSGTQGSCDTYVQWDPSISWMHKTDPFKETIDVQTETTSSLFHPDIIMKISLKGLKELQRSPYLFARKFTSDLQVSDACANSVADAFAYVLTDIPMRPKAPGQLFAGVWLDSNNDEVSIISVLDRPQEIVIQNGHQVEWSGSGRYCGEKADITFANGMRATVSLQDHGNTLTWSNGIQWSRDMGWEGEGMWRNGADLLLMRAFGGGKLIKLINLDDSSKGGIGSVAADARLHVKFYQTGDMVGVVSGEKLIWADGTVWSRHFVAPPCSCVPDAVEWSAPAPRKSNCFRVTLGEHPSMSTDCEPILIWPAMGKGFGFMCDSTNPWKHVGYPTVSVMRILRQTVQPEDKVYLIVRKEFRHAWDVLPCLARSSTARLIDYLILDRNLSVYTPGVYGTTTQEEALTLFRFRQLGIVVTNEDA